VADSASSLASSLAAMRAASARVLKPEVSQLLERHLAQLAARHEAIARAGDLVAPFALHDQAGRLVSSDDLLQRGPLVVSFFRGTWCPYCNLELAALAQSYDEIRALGAELVMVTPESAQSASAYVAAHPVPFPILVDPGAAVAQRFGLAYEMPQYMRELYTRAFGNDLSAKNADGSWRLPIPGRFVVGTDGVIVAADADPDYRARPEPSDTLTVLQRIRATAAAT
jgi:peroxiredoxin